MQDINQGRAWTQTDDEDLKLESSPGETIDHAATLLCRPVDEVLKRAAELGLELGINRRQARDTIRRAVLSVTSPWIQACMVQWWGVEV